MTDIIQAPQNESLSVATLDTPLRPLVLIPVQGPRAVAAEKLEDEVGRFLKGNPSYHLLGVSEVATESGFGYTAALVLKEAIA